MSGIVITPAALHAAIESLRREVWVGQDSDRASACVAVAGLSALAALFDPAHAAPPSELVRAGTIPGEASRPAATAPAEPSIPSAATAAPPTIDLPAVPGAAGDTARQCPAAEEGQDAAGKPSRPPPAQAVEGHPSPPRARRADPGDAPAARPYRLTLSPKQDALLRRLWPDPTVRNQDLRDQVSAAGPTRIASDGTLYNVTRRMGLPPRSTFWAAQSDAATGADAAAGDAPIARDSPQATAPEPASPPAPHSVALHVEADSAPRHISPRNSKAGPDLSGESGSKAEVFEAFDAGQTVRAVANDFGLPLSTVSNWQAEWKLARRQQESAA